MTSGEVPGWGPTPGRPPDPGPAPYADPYGGSYAGPWVGGAGPAAPYAWGAAPGWPPPPGPTDEQLRRLPPPGASVAPVGPRPGTGQRPAVVGLAVCLAVTAGLLWVCGISLLGLVALFGVQAMSPVGENGIVFHTLDEFLLRMGDGLWVPLYGFPVASVVTGFLLLARRWWTRLAHTVVGVAALAWAAWWLRDSLLTWAVVALYVGLAVAVLWTPGATRWYGGRRRRPDPAGVGLNG